MKTPKYLAILLSLFILFACSPDPIIYHSEARLPFYHSSTKTNFKFIKNSNSSNKFEFGVVSAKDDDTLSYILFTPSRIGGVVSDLSDAHLAYSVTLLPTQVKEFLKLLNMSAYRWNDKFDDIKGISYEFFIAPENLIVQGSPNVVRWYSTLRFIFQNNDDGPLATLIMGEGSLKYLYKLDKLSEITDLAAMLKTAMNTH